MDEIIIEFNVQNEINATKFENNTNMFPKKM